MEYIREEKLVAVYANAFTQMRLRKGDGLLRSVALRRHALKLEAFRVVFEHLVVDFVECRCFKIDARLVFALFPKKCGETKPQQQSNDHFRSW
jgi:hypothetical protein